MGTKNIDDICIDICTMLEDSERDKKILDFNVIDDLSGQLSDLLKQEENKTRVLDSSFLELATRLKIALNDDNLVPWEYIPVYNTLFGILFNEFPSLLEKEVKDIRFISYGDLRKTNAKNYSYLYRKK